jgi:hypothetical protein
LPEDEDENLIEAATEDMPLSRQPIEIIENTAIEILETAENPFGGWEDYL